MPVMTLQVKIDQCGETWISQCPAIPGCARRGETKAEALEKLKDTIRLCLRIRAEQGLPLIVKLDPESQGPAQTESIEISAEELKTALGRFYASLESPFEGRLLVTEWSSIDAPPRRINSQQTSSRYSAEEFLAIKKAGLWPASSRPRWPELDIN